MSRKITSGEWIRCGCEDQFKGLFKDGRVHKGFKNWSGPGRYYVLKYAQKCPRGCCYDDVIEVLSEDDAKSEIREHIEQLEHLL